MVNKYALAVGELKMENGELKMMNTFIKQPILIYFCRLFQLTDLRNSMIQKFQNLKIQQMKRRKWIGGENVCRRHYISIEKEPQCNLARSTAGVSKEHFLPREPHAVVISHGLRFAYPRLCTLKPFGFEALKRIPNMKF